ncbi:hypothetical protein HMPREF0277_1802 [Corynebacterium accolens ATCC 49726]|nr:hypothetical protein HMPREF0277_1802 [Corynebacterium accolens ATCC 49726]
MPALLGISRGSSPLTRGAGVVAHSLRIGIRLIPAHAGSTCDVEKLPEPSCTHPRSRGEH